MLCATKFDIRKRIGNGSGCSCLPPLNEQGTVRQRPGLGRRESYNQPGRVDVAFPNRRVIPDQSEGRTAGPDGWGYSTLPPCPHDDETSPAQYDEVALRRRCPWKGRERKGDKWDQSAPREHIIHDNEEDETTIYNSLTTGGGECAMPGR